MVINMKYADEGVDCKKLLLLFLKKIWIIILAAILGAVIGGGIYMFYRVALCANREYQATSKLYLSFAPDESGEIYQAYNGYTWHDLMSTNRILDGTMSYLSDAYTEEEVIAATEASILSDLRVLTVTITADSPDRTIEIMNATNSSLVDMGEREKEFISIEVIGESEATLVTVDSRLPQAVLAGFIAALALAFIALALIYALNDRIYVPGDLKCVTDIPFVGFCFEAEEAGGEKSHGKALQKKLIEDTELNKSQLIKDNGELEDLELTQDNKITEEECGRLRKAGGIILVISYGKTDRTSLAYRIDQMKLQGCKIVGIIIKNADMRFMKWYYNRL